MARNRSQAGARASAEARKRLARTVRPAEVALAKWIEATAAEHAAQAKAAAALAALADAIGVDQAASLTELPAEQVRAAAARSAGGQGHS